MTTAAVIVAAGASARMGEPKQLVSLAGETLLERAVRVAREAGCSPVVMVLGAEAERVSSSCNLGDAVVAVNQRWREGMASSIRAGIEALRAGIAGIGEVHGVVVMTCDQPAVTAEHLRALAATGEVTASEYAGRRGVPAYFPASSFVALQALTGDAGARELLRGARAVELNGGELDVDTPEALDEARQRFE
jgi:molybdenum cofactor cytidylyltransferase